MGGGGRVVPGATARHIHGVLQSTCNSYTLKVHSIRGRPRLQSASQLAACSYQECKHLLHSGALLVTMDRQCGTVCQQQCETVACCYTLFSSD